MPLATTQQLRWLLDGEYTARRNGETFKFLVHTVTTGTLAGQRIIKRPVDVPSTWKGCANLRVDENTGNFNGLYIWSAQRAHVSQDWIDNVTATITTIWQRLEGTPESEIIVILESVPNGVFSTVRADMPVREVDPVARFLNEEETIATRPSFAGIDRNGRSTRTATRPAHVEEAPRRRTPLAMSFFDARIVR